MASLAYEGVPKLTLYDKVFRDHVICAQSSSSNKSAAQEGEQPAKRSKSDTVVTGETYLIYIDRHLVHEVTSPQAFEGLRNAGRQVRRPDCTLATVDHNTPTADRTGFTLAPRDGSMNDFIKEKDSLNQVNTLEENVNEFGLTYFGMNDARQGIVHVIGPQQVRFFILTNYFCIFL